MSKRQGMVTVEYLDALSIPVSKAEPSVGCNVNAFERVPKVTQIEGACRCGGFWCGTRQYKLRF